MKTLQAQCMDVWCEVFLLQAH